MLRKRNPLHMGMLLSNRASKKFIIDRFLIKGKHQTLLCILTQIVQHKRFNFNADL